MFNYDKMLQLKVQQYIKGYFTSLFMTTSQTLALPHSCLVILNWGIISDPLIGRFLLRLLPRSTNYNFPCTLFCHVVLKVFYIRQNKQHFEPDFELPKQQFCWLFVGFQVSLTRLNLSDSC